MVTPQTYRDRAGSYISRPPTDAVELHWNSQPSSHDSQPGVPVFDDNVQYWNPETPVLGVINPHTGTQVRIKSGSAHGSFMQVEVRPSK